MDKISDGQGSGQTTPCTHNAPDAEKVRGAYDVAVNRRWRDSNMAAARDFRERMAQAWKDAEWPEDAA